MQGAPPPFCRIKDSHVQQSFDVHAVRALSSLVVRHGGRVLDAGAGGVCVRVQPDGGPACDVHVSTATARDVKVRVCEAQDSIHSDSGSTPAAGFCWRSRCDIAAAFAHTLQCELSSSSHAATLKNP